MKTIGRILIILAVFFALSGLMVMAVNASGANAPDFGGTLPQIRPGEDGGQPRLENGIRPEGSQNRPERGERGGGGSRWMFGLVKNLGVLAVLVIIIVWPKSVAKKKRKQAALSSLNDGS